MSGKIDSCRGDEKKKQICRDYEVRGIARMALLPGHTIEGCCGDLENEHTIFYYKHRKSGYEDTFSVGKDCAKTFLKILMQPLPPLVDPLQDFQISGVTAVGGQSVGPATNSPISSTGTPGSAIPKINSELYVAINLWCILRKQVPKYTLQRILTNIQTNPTVALQEKDVFDFLKTLAAYKKTLNQMLTDAKQLYPTMKSYKFPTLNSIASRNWIDLP